MEHESTLRTSLIEIVTTSILTTSTTTRTASSLCCTSRRPRCCCCYYDFNSFRQQLILAVTRQKAIAIFVRVEKECEAAVVFLVKLEVLVGAFDQRVSFLGQDSEVARSIEVFGLEEFLSYSEEGAQRSILELKFNSLLKLNFLTELESTPTPLQRVEDRVGEGEAVLVEVHEEGEAAIVVLVIVVVVVDLKEGIVVGVHYAKFHH
ncbi:hypothetical protein Vadar_005783 [Vaccinium darrowii]|uniref:Uncharacterized protein n=1 Tax=Vaccinium darrowii TaxID=229202 RepID=A0ACB7XFQ7_9ERIC|nr:hypothetical protein Vadar_005783 [Vaccinium darrowii]